MTTIYVNSTAQLLTALKGAHPNDDIKLAEGTYSNVALKGLNLTNVTISSADPNKPAVFSDLLVRGSSGISFSNVTLAAGANSPNNVFQVADSKNVSFDHIEVHGVANQGAANSQSAFMIRGSSDVSVTNSAFHDLWHGISMLDDTGVTITGNYFHDIRTDGVRGGGVSNLLIAGNMFADFHPAEGDHPDAIQLWTTNTTQSAHDIVINDNLILRGDGAAIQGIFLRDQVGNLPFQNVKIEGNMAIGTMYNGIAVDGVQNGSITHNTVIAEGAQDSWIRAQADTGLTVAENIATGYVFTNGSAERGAANTLAPNATDGGAGAVGQWLGAHSGFAGAWGDASVVANVLQLAAPSASYSMLEFPEIRVNGTDGADRLIASAKSDSTVDAGAGNDVLTGSANHHATLIGGAGDDTFILKSATDSVVERADGGYDTVAVGFDYTMTENVEALRMTGLGQTAYGNGLDNRLVGSAGDDRIYGMDGSDTIQGGDGNDVLDGGAGVDSLRGDGGNDTLYGGGGSDTLLGGEGNDTLYGGDGNDLIEGGVGNDMLIGGAGSDTFRWRPEDTTNGQSDTILDFHSGEDIINLGLVDANTLTAANDAFKFIGNQSFHGIAGELRFVYSGVDTIVYGDTNGDKIPDFAIALKGMHGVGASDFVL